MSDVTRPSSRVRAGGAIRLYVSIAFCALYWIAAIASAQAATIPATIGWYDIPNTHLRSVCPPDNFNGSGYSFRTNCNNVLAAWNSAVLDTLRNRLIIWGGGHNDYPGNEVYALDLNSLTISRLTDPGLPIATACPDSIVNGTQPNSRHTYNGLEYAANVDKMFVFGGALSTCGWFTQGVWAFNLSNNQWEKKNPSGPIPRPDPGIVTAYDPNTQKILVHDTMDLYSYDPVADAFQKLSNNGNGIDYHTSAVIDPKRKKLVIVGGGDAWIYDISGGAFTKQALSTSGGSAIISSGYPGLAYDPTRDRIVAWNGGNAVYDLDLGTNTWSSTSYTGGPATSDWGAFGHWRYSPALGAFVTIANADIDAYAIRLSPPSNSPPAPSPFDFSISNPAAQSVLQGQSVTPAVTATLTSGTAQTVAFSIAGLPSGVTSSFSATSCVPTCTTTLTLTISPTTPASSSTVTIMAAAGSTSRSTSFTLTVTTPAPSSPPPSSPPPSSGGQGTAFQLSSLVTGTLPFTVGLGFKKGDIPGVPVLDISSSQVVVKSRWSDNSVKHAIASGAAALTAGVPLNVNVTAGSAGAAGANLTTADIQAAAPSASVQLGAIGTVSLAGLLGTPFRTWISGPQMVEAHYRSAVGSDPSLVVWFYVRLYKSGRIWIRTSVENGYLDVSTDDKTYTPIVTIGNVVVYNNAGAALTHYAHTRWTAEGWIGGDPQVTPRLDTTYLMDSKLVPDYWKRSPSASALGGLYQTYSPMQNGGWTPGMGGAGFQEQIGLLPLWDALYLTSGADSRAFKSVIANAQALNSYPIVWNDSSTKLPVMPSNRPTWTVDGPGAGGETQWGAGPLAWDIAHHGSGGYLAYLITGDYYFLETMENQSAMCYLLNTSSNGSGTSRMMLGQTRGSAWCQRTVGQLAGIAPSDSIVNDYRQLLANNATHWYVEGQRPGQNLLGYLYEYGVGGYGVGTLAPWQQHFMAQSYGHVSDLEPFADMTTWNSVRDHLYTSIVGILGTGGTNNYCYTEASAYTVVVAADNNNDPATWFDSWGMVYQSSFGVPNTNCGTVLNGTSGGHPTAAATGYWGNLLPAIAYAVDHGATGASTAWNRLTAASNWSVVESSGFDDIPNWGIVPRSTNTSAPPSQPPPSTSFDFSISNGGNKTVAQASSVANTINLSVISGSAQSVALSVSGLPSGATSTFSSASCIAPCSSTLNISTSSSTAAGAYTITVSGSTSSLIHTTTFSLSVTATNPNPPSPPSGPDTTPPSVAITSPIPGASVSGTSVTIFATASDNIGVIGVQFKLDGANLGAEKTAAPFSMTWNTTGTSIGSHVLTAVARDAAGNQGATAAVNVTVSNVDTTPPTISIGSIAPVLAGTVNVPATAADNFGVAGVQFKLDGVSLGAEKADPPYFILWNTTGISDGIHTLTAVARDAAGNQATSPSVTVTVDNTPPAVSVGAPSNGATVSGAMTVSASASDNTGVAGVQFTLDGANLGSERTTAPYSISWDTTTIGDGSHVITAVARDTAGNRTASSQVSVVVSNGASTGSYTIPDNGGRSQTLTSTDPQLAIGSILIQPDSGKTTPAGFAVLDYRAGGVLVSEATVPASPLIQAGRTYVEVNDGVNTGVAIANPGSDPTTVTFYFTAADGNTLGQGMFTLSARQQVAAFLNQPPFNGPASIAGSFTFTSSRPVSAVAFRGFVNERNEFLFAPLPVSDLQAGLQVGVQTMADFADGDGWTTQVALINPTDLPQSGTVQFLDPGAPNDSGLPIQLVVNGVAATAFDYLIPPRGAVRLVTGNTGTSIRVGSVQVTPATNNTAPSAVAIFSYRRQGVTVTAASVPALQPATSFRLYVESAGAPNSLGSLQTSIALANPSLNELQVYLELRTLDGAQTGLIKVVTLPPKGQLSRFVGEFFPDLPLNFRGIMRLSSNARFVMQGLRGWYNERSDFIVSSIPPSDETVPSRSQSALPHVVQGADYATQIILFNAAPGIATGRLLYSTQAGESKSGMNWQQMN
jgi:hypothetical protein